jgi:hypothetical protein
LSERPDISNVIIILDFGFLVLFGFALLLLIGID